MTKKIFVMVFFWATLIGLFYTLLTKAPPPGTTLHITNYKLDVGLRYVGIFIFSCMVGFCIGESYYFLTRKNIK
jgi:hypothetical protein